MSNAAGNDYLKKHKYTLRKIKSITIVMLLIIMKIIKVIVKIILTIMTRVFTFI